MHGRRPWDFEQEFEVTPDGEVGPEGYFGDVANHFDFEKANAVEREEVRELADDARKRHAFIELHDMPWGRRPV